MPYSPTTWTNQQTALNAAHMNNLEDGVSAAPYGPDATTGEAPISDGAGGWTMTNLDKRYAQTFNVLAYGAVGNGSTNDTAAIQAAIDAADAAGGGIVYFPLPSSSYIVNGTLDLTDMSHVALVGETTTRNQHGTTGGVQIKRASGTGTMVTWTASSTTSITGARIENIGFDGNSLAATGVLLGDWYGCSCNNTYVRNCTSVNYDLVGGHTTLGFQNNVFNGTDSDTFSTGAIAMRWRSYSPGSGNVSLNNFHKLGVTHKDGTGLDCGDSDSNFVYGMQCSTGHTGTGVSILLRGSATPGGGHARSNNFFGCQPVNGVTAQGTDTGGITQPSHHNRFFVASENTVPAPTYGTGATLVWALDTGVTYLPNNTITYSRNNAGTNDVIMWRIDTSDQLVTPTYMSANGGASVSGGELRILGGGGALYGLDLTGGSFSTGAMLIPNNVALYGINQAGAGVVNMWRVDTSDHVVSPTYVSLNGGASVSGGNLTIQGGGGGDWGADFNGGTFGVGAIRLPNNVAMYGENQAGIGTVNMWRVDTSDHVVTPTYVSLNGGASVSGANLTMGSDIAMGANKITNLGTATANNDAIGWPWPLTGSLKNVQVFTANGTWNKPATGTCAVVVLKGAGGGGGGGTTGASSINGGAGGGGGGWVIFGVQLAALGATAAVTVGMGGTAGAAGNGGGTGTATTQFDTSATGNCLTAATVTAATGGTAGGGGATTGGSGGTASAPVYTNGAVKYAVTSNATNGGTGGTQSAFAGSAGATNSGGGGGGINATPTAQAGGAGATTGFTSNVNGAAGAAGAGATAQNGAPGTGFLNMFGAGISAGGGGGGGATGGSGKDAGVGADGYGGGGGGGGGSCVTGGTAGAGGRGGDGFVVVFVY